MYMRYSKTKKSDYALNLRFMNMRDIFIISKMSKNYY